MSQTKAQLLDNIKDNVQLDARNSLRFADTDSSHYVAFKAPATVSSNVTWTLPAADGSANYVLATDGSGTLSWIADPAGQWTTSGSNIYFTGGNVGIGDSSPSNPLSVTGASSFNGDVTFTGASYNAVWDKSDNALEFADNAKATFGASADLKIHHAGGTTNKIESGANTLYLAADDLQITNAAISEACLKTFADGAVELYYDNSKKFETTSTGVTITPDLIVNGSGDTAMRWALGGTNKWSIFNNSSGGDNKLQIFDNNGSGTAATFNTNGSVELYYDNSKKFETNTGGAQVFGNLYLADTVGLWIGDSSDLKISHDGTQSIIETNSSATKPLHIKGDPIHFYKTGGSELFCKMVADAGVELYHDNSKKFETTSSGVSVTGSLSLTDDLNMEDGDQIEMGTGNDFKIFHSTNNYLESHNDTEIHINAYTGGSTENMAKFKPNADVELYYNNVNTFQTAAHGATIHNVADPRLVIQGSGHPQLDLSTTGTTDNCSINFGDADDADAGEILYNHTDERLAFYTSGTERMRIGESGRFRVGCTAQPSSSNKGIELSGKNGDNYVLLATYTNNAYNIQRFLAPAGESGYIQTSGASCTYTSASDYRLKQDDVVITNGITRLKQLRPIRFKWKYDTSIEQDGFIAHEAQTVVPEAVTGTKDAVKEDGSIDTQAMDYGRITPLLTAALQEAVAKIETLETKVAALESA